MVALTSWLVSPASTAPDPAAWQGLQVRDDGVYSGGSVTLQTGRTARMGAARGWCGGFPWNNPGNTDITSDANPNGNPLIDRLVVRLTWGVGISLEIKRGIASASPEPPALTQIYGGVWEMPIAYWAVAPSSANSISELVTDKPGREAAWVEIARNADLNVDPVSGVWTPVGSWTTTTRRSGTGLGVGSSGVTVSATGQYDIEIYGRFGTNSTNRRGCAPMLVPDTQPITIGGIARQDLRGATSGLNYMHLRTEVPLNAGQKVTAGFYQDSGGPLGIAFMSLLVRRTS